MPLFKSNSILINLFLKNCKTNLTSFYEPIIDLYLSENEANTQKNQIFLEEMLRVPGHIMPTENPHIIQPASATTALCDKDAMI